MSFKNSVLLLFIGIFIGIAVKYITGPSIKTFGTDFTPPAPETVSLRIPGFLSEDSEFNNFDLQIENFLRRWHLTGASVAIAKDGNMVYSKGYGYADKESNVKAEPYHLFRIASISKLITATGIMKLVEDGNLNIEDNVFGPDGILNKEPYNEYLDRRVENITVEHLLNHSGGWTNRWGDPMFMPRVIARHQNVDLPVSDEDIISFMLARRLHFTPGGMSSYSNLGYVILGKVIEELTNQSYEEYIQTSILYPLGIFDMRLGESLPEQRVENEVKYYEPLNATTVKDFMGTNDKASRAYGGNDIKTLGAAGGWIASATDLMKFMLAIDGDPSNPNILSKESIETMTTPVRPGFQPFGWRATSSRIWYRTGTLSGTSTLMLHRQDGISYVVLFNSSTWKGPMLSRDIRRMMDIGVRSVNEWPKQDLFELANEIDFDFNQKDLIEESLLSSN
ncbi:serine hydrolase [Marinilabiliaceae bacterium ANBcel2]|nr:serine hydrolase [Marinilabiliaceae bacterium ANBcel2]